MTKSNWQICQECRGEGHHKYLDENAYYGYGEISYFLDDCKACNGSGKINDTRTAEEKQFDEECIEEVAREEGMLQGIHAYNEVKGY